MSTPSPGPLSWTVASRISRDLIRFAVSLGADEDAMLANSGIDPATLRDLEGRVPGEQHERLWAAAVAGTGTPDFGLHLGSQRRPGTVSLVGFVLLSAPTLRDAYDDCARYVSLFSEGIDLRLDEGRPDRLASMTLRPVRASRLSSVLRQPNETVLASLVSLAREVTGRPLPVRHVAFAHDRPETGTATHEAVFGVVPTFGAPETRLAFDARALRWAGTEASPRLHAALRHEADEFVERLHPPLQKRVAMTVAERLRGSVPTLADVAGDLAMGERSLQRHLEGAGTTYIEVVDGVRQRVAQHHLDRAEATIHEVAFLLGYSEPSAFHRAFKRWTGVTPNEYREAKARETA